MGNANQRAGTWLAITILGLGLLISACRKNEGSSGATGATGATGDATNTGTLSGLSGTVGVSTPAGGGGAFFDTGEAVTLTITTTAATSKPGAPGSAPSMSAKDLNSTNFSSARLYIYGPLDQSKTVAAQNLMRQTTASGYVNLLSAQAGLTVSGSVATFETNPVAAEEPGTYRAVIRLTSATAAYERTVLVEDFQVKTATVETETVNKTKCAKCHQGADNGQFYFHHVDVSSSNTTGSFEIDNEAIASCKACHNQAGYANTTDDWVAARTRTPDPLIRRVHGIHNGEELKRPRNTHRMALGAVVVTSSWAGLNPEDPAPFVGLGLIRGQTSGAEARINNSDGTAAGATWFGLGHVTGGDFQVGETVDVLKITDLTKTGYSAISGTNKIGTAVVAESLTYNSDGSTNSVAVQEGYFADYTTVVYPPDVRSCTKCHADDNWKTKPNQQACGACHDNVWFGDATATPEGYEDHPGGEIADIKNGVARAEYDVSLCSTCHDSSSNPAAGNTQPIETVHEVPTFYAIDQATPATQEYTAELTMSTPANSSYYVAGEAPVVYVKLMEASTGSYVDPATVTQAAWSGMSLYCAGPRAERSTPVLSTTSRGTPLTVTCATAGTWDLSGSPTFSLYVASGSLLTFTAAPANFAAPASATQAEVVTWLNNSFTTAGYNNLAKAITATGNKVSIKTKPGFAGFPITSSTIGSGTVDIKTGTVTTRMGWPKGRTTLGSTYGNDLRRRTDTWDNDPKVTWDTANLRIAYQLGDVSGLTDGTYTVYVTGFKTARPDAFALTTFQVGTATADKYIAKNCSDCHDIHLMHLDASGRHPAQFNTDYCKNCHDYQQEKQDSDVWAAFGADPIVKKVHGVHRGHYLTYPDKIYPNNPIWSGIIFPQDIRNCTKCHSSDTTGSWKTEPSRLACGSCHDSDTAEAHMSLQTSDATPTYDSTTTKTGGAWSGDEVESCATCHGEGKEYAPDKVHNITTPYAPPYAREPED